MLEIDLRKTTIFNDNAGPGDQDYKCSKCGQIITDEEIALLLWPSKRVGIYRFCEDCSNLVLT